MLKVENTNKLSEVNLAIAYCVNIKHCDFSGRVSGKIDQWARCCQVGLKYSRTITFTENKKTNKKTQ